MDGDGQEFPIQRKEQGQREERKIKPFPLELIPCTPVYVLGPELGHMATLSCKGGRLPSRKWESYY